MIILKVMKFCWPLLFGLAVTGCGPAEVAEDVNIAAPRSSEISEVPVTDISLLKTERVVEAPVQNSVTNVEIFPPLEIKEPESACEIYDDFAGDESARWQIVNDNVMGGRSLGSYNLIDETLILSGNINLNGGGFSSVRSPLPVKALEDYDRVVIRAKTDGRGYDITFRDSNRRGISHRTRLNFENLNQWEELSINFDDLYPAYFGRSIQAEPFNKSAAREIGFILNDGQGGPFQLEIDWVKFCQDS